MYQQHMALFSNYLFYHCANHVRLWREEGCGSNSRARPRHGIRTGLFLRMEKAELVFGEGDEESWQLWSGKQTGDIKKNRPACGVFLDNLSMGL